MEGGERLREYERAVESARRAIVDVSGLWLEYDRQNDILYINFGKEEAEESVMVDDDIVAGLKGGRLTSISIFNFKRKIGLE
ncbi:MAG: DUF2283 domain-containing protein [Desulfurococcales archaeon]|nr:DUF2283 domain-containing protein [Desulfurococcales archaeon]